MRFLSDVTFFHLFPSGNGNLKLHFTKCIMSFGLHAVQPKVNAHADLLLLGNLIQVFQAVKNSVRLSFSSYNASGDVEWI